VEHAVSGLTDEGAILDGREMRAKWVIGADGIHSRVEALVGLDHALQPEDTIRAETALSNSVMDGLRRDLLGRNDAGLCKRRSETKRPAWH